MPSVDVVDETFIVVPPAALAAVFSDPSNWSRFWPDLRLSVYVDRGDAGIRWTVQGALTGTMEVWLEPVLDGTLLHYFLRADPPVPFKRSRDQLAAIRTRQIAAKSIALDLKRQLESGRPAGVSPRST